MIDHNDIQYPYAPRERKHHAPTVGIFDSPYTCIRLNMDWAGHIIGLLGVLLESDSWHGNPTEIFRIQQEIHRLIRAMKDDSNCGDCDGDDPEDAALEMRVTPECVLQYSTDDGLNWHNVPGWEDYALACFVGPQGEPGQDGADGTPGAQGEQGPPGEDCACDPTNMPPDPPAIDDPNRSTEFCGIAVTIVDYMKSLSDDFVSGFGVFTDLNDVIANIIAATGVGDIIIDNLWAIGNGILGTVVSTYDALISTDVIEALKCEMYCEIRLQGAWSSAIWEPWKQRVHENPVYTIISSGAIDIFMSISGARTDNFWNARATIGSHSPSEFCTICPCADDWCIEVLIGADTEGLNVLVGDFVPGDNRIESERISVPSQAIEFTIDLGGDFFITRAVMTTIVINGGSCGSVGVSDRENYVKLLEGGSVVAENIVMVNHSCQDYDVTPDGVDNFIQADFAHFRHERSAASDTPLIAVSSVRFYGFGDKPTIGQDC